MTADPEHPKIPYWHLWTDDDGATHQTRYALTDFDWRAWAVKPRLSGTIIS